MADTSLVFNILAKDKTGHVFSSMSNRAKVAFAAAGAAVGAFAVSSVKAAAQDQQAQAVLAQTLKNSAGARQTDIASVESWIQSLTLATGVADDQLRPALGSLVRATGDTAKAQGLLKTAMDVSAATGKPLETVSLALAKAAGGNSTALQRLGINMKDAHGKALPFTDAVAKLNSQFGGAQAAKTASAAGQFQVLSNRFQEAKETVGSALLPVVTALMAVISDHTGAVVVLAAVFGTLALTVGAVSFATSAYTAVMSVATAVTTAWRMAQFALNVALAANPIGVIVIAIIALVAGIVLAYKKSETFRNIVTGAFRAVGAAVSWVWNWIKDHWPLLLAILTGPIGLAVLAISKHKDSILGFFKAIPGKIKGFFTTLVDILTFPFRTAFNAIAGLWNNTLGKVSFTIPSWVPGVGGKGFSFPQIPILDSGGIVSKPTLALLAANSRPEAVVPLGRGGLGAGVTVNIDARGSQMNESAFRRIVDQAFAELVREVRAG